MTTQPAEQGTPEYGVVIEPGAIRLERLLPGPIERVWTYITESEKRKTWFAGGTIELRIGGRVELVFDHRNITDEPTPERFKSDAEGSISHGRVLRCEPPTLLTFSWEGSGDGSEVTFELATQGDEVLLVLTHKRLATREELADVSAGWHLHLDVLEDRLLGHPTRPFWPRHAQLEAEYEKLIRPEGAPAPVSERDALR